MIQRLYIKRKIKTSQYCITKNDNLSLSLQFSICKSISVLYFTYAEKCCQIMIYCTHGCFQFTQTNYIFVSAEVTVADVSPLIMMYSAYIRKYASQTDYQLVNLNNHKQVFYVSSSFLPAHYWQKPHGQGETFPHYHSKLCLTVQLNRTNAISQHSGYTDCC